MLLCISKLLSGRCSYRTCSLASAAVDASALVDNVLSVALCDAPYGAGFCASSTGDALV